MEPNDWGEDRPIFPHQGQIHSYMNAWRRNGQVSWIIRKQQIREEIEQSSGDLDREYLISNLQHEYLALSVLMIVNQFPSTFFSDDEVRHAKEYQEHLRDQG